MEPWMWAARLVGAAALALPAAGLELAGPAASAPAPARLAGQPPAAGAAAIAAALAPDRITALMQAAGLIRGTAAAPQRPAAVLVRAQPPAGPRRAPGPRPEARPHPPARTRPEARNRPGTGAGQRPVAVTPGVLRQAAAFAAVTAAPLVTSGNALRSKRGRAAPPMSAAMLEANALKQAQARRFVAWLRRRRVSPDENCTTRACLAGVPAARAVARTQQPQARNYWCGPATVSEMLRQLGPKLSQAEVAKQLRTSRGGTDWSNRHGYPVPQVLNQNQARNSYVAVALPWSPTGKQVRVYQRDLVADLNKGRGVPLAGNAYEVPGGPHLVGHPPGQTITHWIDIRGYSHFGLTTKYEDSVHGAASIGWAASVPAYSSLPSRTVVYILGARGYDW
jgi:hypothetical protein